jgi:hypothetical protein
MECMEGPRWKAVLQEEEAHIKQYTSKRQVQERLGPFELQYRSANEKQQGLPFQCGPANVTWNSAFFKTWWFRESKKKQSHSARDLVGSKNRIWTTEDVGDGAESFELQAWEEDHSKPLWTKGPVGPDVGLLGSKLVYLGVKNKLIYHQVWICDAATGTNERCIYKESSDQVNLSLEKHADGRLRLIRDNSQDIDVLEVIPSGAFLRRKERYPIPRSWILPLTTHYSLEFVWQTQGLVVLRHHGKSVLWKCIEHRAPKKLLEIPAGQILFDPYSVHAGNLPTLVCVTRPDTGSIYYTYNGTTLTLTLPVIPTGLQTRRYHTKSSDGTIVHGVVTYMKGQEKPNKLLMIGYGAYGMATNTGSVLTRWAPLVQSGWVIGHTFLRGGGDHTEAWAKNGRRQGRNHTVDDFIALVKAAQGLFHIPSNRTAIYGRSAGGLLVGSSLARFPDGSLMGAVYAEVPYVDELRTTTNPDLPLTKLETNEFGAPAERLEDFLAVGMLSPADSAVGLKTPTILVLTRTAENDSQVFAYESVKWIRRLRQEGSKAPKLCIVEKDQGHFTPVEKTIQQYALDCAILDSWFS